MERQGIAFDQGIACNDLTISFRIPDFKRDLSLVSSRSILAITIHIKDKRAKAVVSFGSNDTRDFQLQISDMRSLNSRISEHCKLWKYELKSEDWNHQSFTVRFEYSKLLRRWTDESQIYDANVSSTQYLFNGIPKHRRAPVIDLIYFYFYLVQEKEEEEEFENLFQQYEEANEGFKQETNKQVLQELGDSLNDYYVHNNGMMSEKNIYDLVVLYGAVGMARESLGIVSAVEKVSHCLSEHLANSRGKAREFAIRAVTQCSIKVAMSAWERIKEVVLSSDEYQLLAKKRFLMNKSSETAIDYLQSAIDVSALLDITNTILIEGKDQIPRIEVQAEFNLIAAGFIAKGNIDKSTVLKYVSESSTSDEMQEVIKQSQLRFLMEREISFKCEEKRRKVNVYLLFSFLVNEGIEASIEIVSELERTQATPVPCNLKYHVSYAQCTVPDGRDSTFRLFTRYGDYFLAEHDAIALRTITRYEIYHFVFGVSFQPPIYTMDIGKSPNSACMHITEFVGFLLNHEYFLEIATELLAKYAEKAISENKQWLFNRLQALPIPDSEDSGLFFAVTLGTFPLEIEAMNEYWDDLLVIGVRNVNQNTISRMDQWKRVSYNCAITGYTLMLEYCLKTGNDYWVNIFKYVAITDKSELERLFKRINLSDSEVTNMVKQLNEENANYMIELLTILYQNIQTFQESFELLIVMHSSCPEKWGEEECISSINTICEKFRIGVSEIDALNTIRSSFRSIIVKSDVPKYIERLITSLDFMNEKRLADYAKIFQEEKWLIPTFDSKSFAIKLITIHHFSPSRTYRALKFLLSDVEDMFRTWLNYLRIGSNPNLEMEQRREFVPKDRWIETVEYEINELEIEGISAPIAKIAIDQLRTQIEYPTEFLSLAEIMKFTSKQFEEEFLKEAFERIEFKMRNYEYSIISNHFLSYVVYMFRSDEKNPYLEKFVRNAFRLLKESPEEKIIEAVLTEADKQLFWISKIPNEISQILFKATRCDLICANLCKQIISGEILFEKFSLLSDSRDRAQTFQILLYMMNILKERKENVEERYLFWLGLLESTRKTLEDFQQEFVISLFQRKLSITDLSIYFPSHQNYSTCTVRFLATIPETLDMLVKLYDKYKHLSKSSLFRTCIDELKGDLSEANGEQIASLLEDAKNRLQKKLIAVTMDLSEVKLSEIARFFEFTPDPKRECEVIKTLQDEDSSRMLLACAESFQSMKENIKLCEAILNCKTAIGLNCEESFAACRGYLSTLQEKKEDILIRELIEISQGLMRVLDSDGRMTPKILSVIRFVGEYNNMIRGLLDTSEDTMTSIRESIGTDDDVDIDNETLETFISLQEFLGRIANKNSITMLVDELMSLLDQKVYENIEQMLHLCFHKWPVFSGIDDEFRSIENKKIRWLEAILTESKAVFNGKDKELQLKITFQYNYRKNHQETDEIIGLRDQCELILHTSSSFEEINSSIKQTFQQFIDLAGLLFDIKLKINELEKIGAPIYMYNQNQTCQISQRTSTDAQSLHSRLCNDIIQWSAALQNSQESGYQLTYVFGYHLWLLETRLTSDRKLNDWESCQVAAWLSCMGVRPTALDKRIQIADSPEGRLRPLGETLNAAKLNHPLDAARRTVPAGKIYYFHSRELSSALVSAYFSLEKRLPKCDQVIVCREETLFCELQAFILHSLR